MYTQVHVRLNFSGFLQLVLFWGQINCSLGVKMVKFLEKVQGKCNPCIGISDGGEEWSRGSQIFSDAHGQNKRQWSKTETHKMTHFMAQVACRACGVSMLGDTHRPGQLIWVALLEQLEAGPDGLQKSLSNLIHFFVLGSEISCGWFLCFGVLIAEGGERGKEGISVIRNLWCWGQTWESWTFPFFVILGVTFLSV